jgi:hypothetical protein
MILNRNQFFLILVILLVGPFYVYKICWLITSRAATGSVWFIGHTLELHGDISQHLVVLFHIGKDSSFFNVGTSLGLHVGDSVPVRYQKDNPTDVRIDSPVTIWGDTLVNSLLPELFLLVLFLTPTRFDPLIPWRARVRIGIKPFIKIVP